MIQHRHSSPPRWSWRSLHWCDLITLYQSDGCIPTMNHWRRICMWNSFQHTPGSCGGSWFWICFRRETFVIYFHLKTFCLLQALTIKLPSPNPRPAHKLLIQFGYNYDHYSSPTVLRGTSWSATYYWVIDQGTHRSSSYTSFQSGGIVTPPLRPLSCRSCRLCLSIFLQTPPRLAWWSCSLLLVVSSCTPSSYWGGWLDPTCCWGAGRLRAGSC